MKKNVNLRCYPYRGILKEMGEELGMPTDQIHKGLFLSKVPNIKLAEIFDRKLQERQAIVKSFRKNLKKVV
ncbi:MAG: hypothetical protein WCK32_00935 [Chlorobiaceae bacterium]